MPVGSITKLRGLVPTTANILGTPAGVILDTLFEAEFVVYTFPIESTAIPKGFVPGPMIMEVLAPAGVILVTVFALEFAVYTFPSESIAIPLASFPVFA